ncbi:MAG: PQQ-dependent sugar dehydrogenase [Flavobacteriaceae bacterium]|nr:PQQ-dependent sugar dehydrogenase [Flavobacteriaceae bacterium]
MAHLYSNKQSFLGVLQIPISISLFLMLSLNCTHQQHPSSELFLPNGFTAKVFVDSLVTGVRHLSVSDNGIVYAKLKRPSPQGSVVMLMDQNKDGKADSISMMGHHGEQQRGNYSTASHIYNGYLYFSSQLKVYRQKLDSVTQLPIGDIETVLIDDHPHRSHEHIAKPLAFDDSGNMYVPFGAPSNNCQSPKRTPLKSGEDPCIELIDHGGIWKFDANQLNQTQESGQLFASGLRSIVALDWNPENKKLYAVMHGRDDLKRLWPDRYSSWQSALLPSEEFLEIQQGDHFGWPYCYYDQLIHKKVLAPEYGGDGEKVDRCSHYNNPIIGFPGHWAPNDLVFYNNHDFPSYYHGGAFVAFHGSTNRAPYSQSGYFVGFIPFENGEPTEEYDLFADGFAGVSPIVNASDALYRPMGIAFSNDGKMYIGDTNQGRIWQIEYTGNRHSYSPKDRKKMKDRFALAHIRTPDMNHDILHEGLELAGKQKFNLYCATCHQPNAQGDGNRFPTLVGTDWVTGDKKRLVKIILQGMEGPIEVNGKTFNGIMPPNEFLSDQDVAEILTYLRTHFGNQASPITSDEVYNIRHDLHSEL